MQAQNKSPLNAKYRAIEPPPMIKIKANHQGIISTSNTLWRTLYQKAKYTEGNHQPRVGRTGSGTTLLACKQLGIKCIGIELDESSCEIAAKRCQSINQEAMELIV
jgi:hypothetical protein